MMMMTMMKQGIFEMFFPNIHQVTVLTVLRIKSTPWSAENLQLQKIGTMNHKMMAAQTSKCGWAAGKVISHPCFHGCQP